MRLIDADALVEDLEKVYEFYMNEIKEANENTDNYTSKFIPATAGVIDGIVEAEIAIHNAPTIEPDGDLISRQDAIEALGEEPEIWNDTEEEWAYRNAWVEHISAIKSLPSADRQEVESATISKEGITFYYRKKGEWIEEDEYGDLWVCDQCGFASEHRDNYCPNCGAKMVREDGEEE